MSLLDRVQKQQGPDPSAVPDGSYVPQAGNSPARQSSSATRTRTPFELQAERVKNRLQARLTEQTAAEDSGGERREQRAARSSAALKAGGADIGPSLTTPGKQRTRDAALIA